MTFSSYDDQSLPTARKLTLRRPHVPTFEQTVDFKRDVKLVIVPLGSAGILMIWFLIKNKKFSSRQTVSEFMIIIYLDKLVSRRHSSWKYISKIAIIAKNGNFQGVPTRDESFKCSWSASVISEWTNYTVIYCIIEIVT